MSDPLSVAGSVAGLVSLSASVFQQVSKFIKEAKGAEKKVRELSTQTRDLSGILQNLALLALSLEHEDASVTFKVHHLYACGQTLFEIEKRLEKAQKDFDNKGKKGAIIRSLKWPFSVDETNSLVNDMALHRSTLELALSAETLEKLLQCLQSQDEMKAGIASLIRKVERVSTIQIRVEMDKKRKEITDFFLRVNPQANFQTVMRLRQPLTGLWLTESNDAFQKWKDMPNSALWLSGIPGAGKTILCGVAIEEILQLSDDATAVAFFFCDHKSNDSQKLVNILSSLAVQLAQQNDAAFRALEDYFARLHPANGLPQQPEVEDLEELLSDMALEYKKVFIIVDGLDECGSNAQEVARHLKMLSQSCPSINMAVFSRNEPDIEEELADTFAHIEIAAQEEDLNLFVRAEMGNRKQLQRLGIQNHELAEEIRQKLISGAQGMFRWVACQLDYLCELTTNRARREALDSLPPTLHETYHRLLLRVVDAGAGVSRLVKNALHWTAVDRQLTLAQLREGISLPDTQVDNFGEDDLVDMEEILRNCSSLTRLVRYDDDDGNVCSYIEFAHFTVVEYLKEIDPSSDVGCFKLDYRVAEATLTATCLRSVLRDNKDVDYSISHVFLKHVTDDFHAHPFCFYAANRLSSTFLLDNNPVDWAQAEESHLFEDMKTLFDPQKHSSFLKLAVAGLLQTWGTWLGHFDQLFWDTFTLKMQDHLFLRAGDVLSTVASPFFTPLTFAAVLGLPKLCQHLLEVQSGMGHDVLQAHLCCAIYGPWIFKTSTDEELEDPIKFRVNYTSPRRATISLFVGLGAARKLPVDVPPVFPQPLDATPLFFAVMSEDERIVEILLREGADAETKGNTYPYHSPLDRALWQGSHRLAQMIQNYLSTGIVTSSGSVQNSAFFTRTVGGDNSTVWKAKPSPQFLKWAILQDSGRLCDALIADGVSKDAPMPGCTTCPVRPIFKAIEYYKPEAIKSFISGGADLQDLWCRLHPLGLESLVSLAAVEKLPAAILNSLLDATLAQRVPWLGGHLNSFHVAALSRSPQSITNLKSHLQMNFDSYKKLYENDSRYETRQGFASFLSTAVNAMSRYTQGIRNNWPDFDFFLGTPLHYAVAAQEETCVDLLIEYGADVGAVDDHQRSPLFLAVEINSAALVKRLLAAGASLDLCDYSGATILMRAVKRGNVDIIRHLEEASDSIEACDIFGKNILHYIAIGTGTAGIFVNFLGKGINGYQHHPGQPSPVTAVFDRDGDNEHLTTYVLNANLLLSVDKRDIGNPILYTVIQCRPTLLKIILRFLKHHGTTQRFIDRMDTTVYPLSPLCSAVTEHSIECLETLLVFGADINKEGCFRGSPLMAATTQGLLPATKVLVRRGALIEYTNDQGVYRNAFEAGKHHEQIREWFLVGRYQDQSKLAAETHWNEVQPRVREWGGVTKAEIPLKREKRRDDESLFDFLCVLETLKKEARGKVIQELYL